MQNLNSKTLSENTRKILISMSHFGSIGGDKEAVLVGSAISEEQFAPCMNELWTTSLVEVGGSLENVRYSLHSLTQYFVLSDIVKVWSQPQWKP